MKGAPPAAWFVSVLSRNVALGEHDAQDSGIGGPPAPEDRTWRHPAEVAWEASQAATQRIASSAAAAEVIADDITNVRIGVTARDPKGGVLGLVIPAVEHDN